MKVLWFSVTPSLFVNQSNSEYKNRGGWISSLEKIITSSNNIDLSVAFWDENLKIDCGPIIQHGVTYFPIKRNRGILDMLSGIYSSSNNENARLNIYKRIIDKCNPDIIQVFGSEWDFGLIFKVTSKPVVIHIQGNWYSIRNNDFPHGCSLCTEIIHNLFNPKKCLSLLANERKSKLRAKQEINILMHHKYFFGRTWWDKTIVSLFSPNSKYLFCNEALREEIINSSRFWNYVDSEEIILCTVGAGQFIKGYDVIFKTISILKKIGYTKIKWKLIGVEAKRLNYLLKLFDCSKYADSVYSLGKVGPEILVEELVSSNFYIHPSYIDNSSNAICEAQYLGLPVIATNVGGTSSLFDKDYNKNMIIPPNDPIVLASSIVTLLKNRSEQVRLSKLNFKISHTRHAPQSIFSDLYNGYLEILNHDKCI